MKCVLPLSRCLGASLNIINISFVKAFNIFLFVARSLQPTVAMNTQTTYRFCFLSVTFFNCSFPTYFCQSVFQVLTRRSPLYSSLGFLFDLLVRIFLFTPLNSLSYSSSSSQFYFGSTVCG